jgi:class 3 adenylate cyclase/TolB-like protein/Tfp pilus assembly protein PilF
MTPLNIHPVGDVERLVQTVLFVDIVESVRLMERDEEDAIRRWRDMVEHIECHVLPACDGRLVKSTGDGLLLAFGSVQSAISAAFAIQHAMNRRNHCLPADRHMLLRMGMEVSDVVVDQYDVYGRGVMLAARLMTLAGPGEIVVSAHVRDQLTPVLDADVEDLGECHLKHIKNPVRAYRIGPPGEHPVVEPVIPFGELLPTIAVIPFSAREAEGEHNVLGEVIADEIISALSRSSEMNVISRLSTTAFRGREVILDEISAHLNANYVLSGVYRVKDRKVLLDAELAEAKSGQIVWAERLEDEVQGILSGEQVLIERVVADVCNAVMARELQRARSQALPTLKSYTLLMAAISLMHRLSLRDFEDARHMLQTLIDRATRQSVPLAWMAKWHVLRVQQGWSADPEQDGQFALECTKRALEADPQSSLALAIDGFVHTNLLKRLDVAEERYERAIQINPNDALAWLLKGTLHAFKGEGAKAVDDTQRALKLTPLDPHRYFYDSLSATACLAANQYENALELARRSLRANRTHTSTLRVMAAAHWRMGHQQEARATAQELMKLEPNLTVSRWLARSPSAPYKIGEEWAEVLRQVGVPN